MSDIAYRLKEFRKELGNMTQAEFAKPLGITGAHISKIEKGKTTPSESLIKLICKEYRINESWLVDGKEPMDADELEEIIDTKMIKSTQTISKMLRIDEPELRLAVAKLNSLFADMVNIDSTDINKSIEYLGICEQLLKDINKYIEALKAFSIEGVIPTNTLNTTILFDKYHKSIETDLRTVLDFFIRSEPSNKG